jgi:enoyl-CoA hydratase/carnithine racemase
MNEHVAVEVADHIQTVRFERAEKSNALTADMFDAATEAISLADTDSSVRVVLVTGMPGVFTAGHDVDALRAFMEDSLFGEAAIRFMKTLATNAKPIIAAVDGLSVGVGTVLLLYCDFVVASEWSIFSAPFADLGMLPEGGASLLAPRIMGHHRAFELLVMGEQFDAHRAMAAGLVNRVVLPEDIDAAGIDFARTLVDKPPETVRLARRLLRGDHKDLLSRINQEAAAFVEILRSPAARDAMQSHIDRRRG